MILRNLERGRCGFNSRLRRREWRGLKCLWGLTETIIERVGNLDVLDRVDKGRRRNIARVFV